MWVPPLVASLQKALDEVLGEGGLGVLLGAEVLEDVGELLPVVEGFLVFLVGLEEQDVDCVQLSDVTVSLEFLSHLCPDGGDGHVQRVHGLDLGSRSEPFPVGSEDPLLCIVPVDGRARPLCEIGWVDHCVDAA